MAARQARALIAVQMPDLAHLAVRRVGKTGTDNVLYRVGSKLVARFPRQPFGAAEIRHLARWLPPLQPDLGLAVPIAHRTGAPDGSYPFAWSVGPWLAGQNAFTAPPDQDAAVPVLARFLKALHGKDRPVGAPLRGQADRVDLRLRACRKVIDQFQAGEADPARLHHLLTQAQAVPPFTGDPVWIHGDLHPANLLTQRARLCAVIDWGGMGLGDPGMDLMVAWTLFDAPARAQFKAAMAPDPAAWARGRAQALAKAIMAIPYYRQSNPVFRAQMLQTLRRVSEDCDY